MRKNLAKLMAIRMGVYGLMMVYLGCDLFVFKGPVHHSLNPDSVDSEEELAEAKASGVVARVYARPIFRAQVEEAMKEYLWRRGRTVAETSDGERKTLRLLIVNQLIDDELVKVQIKVSTNEEVAVSEGAIEEALALEMQRYPAREVFDSLADQAGWSGIEEREFRVAARIQRAEHLARMVDVSVDDEEVRAWFEENKDQLSGDFGENEGAIREALLAVKRGKTWKSFRVAKLRRWAEGAYDLYEDVLYPEEGE